MANAGDGSGEDAPDVVPKPPGDTKTPMPPGPLRASPMPSGTGTVPRVQIAQFSVAGRAHRIPGAAGSNGSAASVRTPIAGAVVRAYDRELRRESMLGETR